MIALGKSDIIQRKQLVSFLWLEFLGTLFITLSYNLAGKNFEGVALTFFLATLWSWQHSCAHFNIALTLGEAIYNFDTIGEHWKGYLYVIATQTVATLFGILVTFFITRVTVVNDWTKTFSPAPPTLCPAMNGFRCTSGNEQQPVLKFEFICSTMFVFSWLIIRNFESHTTYNGISNIVKPFMVYFVYFTCIAYGATTSYGTLNPTLAFGVLIWDAWAYGSSNVSAAVDA